MVNIRSKTQPLRASWRGELRLELVSFRVSAYNALSPDEADIQFHQLHEGCGARVQHQKACPIHGNLAANQIVLGYEYGRNQYVEIAAEELARLRAKAERSLSVDRFIEPHEVDPIYFDGRSYYLAPERAEDEEPYAVFCEALRHSGRFAVGTIVFSEREQLVLIRPVDRVLAMMMLRRAPQIRSPGELGVHGPRQAGHEIELAEELIAAETDRQFDLSEYEDDYQKRLAELIEAKIEGRALHGPEEKEPEPPVLNLADALQRSLRRAQERGPKHPGGTTKTRSSA